MIAYIRLFGLILIGLLLASCSSTSMSSSWSNPEFKGQIEKVYIIGMAKSENNRRIFEDTFKQQLASQGVESVTSYKGLPSSEEINKSRIIQQMTTNSCDSVLLTKLIGQRKQSVTRPGRVSGYSYRPYNRRDGYYNRPAYYNNWNSYYNQRVDVIYEPPTTTHFTVLSVESVIYDLKTEEMIWSAQLETVVEGDIEKMMQDFVEQVTKDLKNQGLI